MTMSLTELDAQDVKLLPERATLHHGGASLLIINQTAAAGVVNLGGAFNWNTAVATIINL